MATTTTTTTPSGWANDAAFSNWQLAQQAAQRPYTPYPGAQNMLAGWDLGQQTGYNAVLNGGGVGQGAQALGQQFATQAGQYAPQQVQASGYAPAMQGVMNTAAASAGPATPWGVMNTAAADAGPAQQMAASQMGRGEVGNVTAGQFPGADLNQYMNPYTGQVIDRTLQTMGRQNDILQNQANAKASAAGAFGGSRQAIMNSENNRNFMDAAANTTANLSNQNFAQAQAAIAADQNRALQAGGMNQQADLTVGQANLANRQQSGLQNMLAGNQMAQFNAGNQQTALNQTAAAHNSAAAQQASNANQMAQYNAGLQQQAGAATSAAHNAALANQAAAQNAAGQFNSDLGLRAQLANQQAGQNAANTSLQAANALNGMGLDEQTRALRAAQAQYGMGQNMQAFNQSALTDQYNQWQQAQNYPLEQLKIQQSGLAGVPYGSTSTSPYYSNTGANILAGGLGIGQLGAGILQNGSAIASGASSLANMLPDIGAPGWGGWFG